MGYVANNTIEGEKRPLRRLTLPTSGKLVDAAGGQAGILKTLPMGSPLDVLAVSNSFQLVRSVDGQTGWIFLPIGMEKPINATVR
ncbi:SH3 domain-containing protein [Spirosoma sp. KNUC1025]|uniref:SH3 domain-containing protein n=1 Tax=Spirosoma sp. KNUC1025 TaxID=2894082 RepID=UPI003864B8B9